MFLEKYNKPLSLIGRIAFSLPFMGFGINHFIKPGKYMEFVPAYMPAPEFWVYFVAVCLILASISMLLNYKARLASLLLALMISLFILMIYLPEYHNNMSFIATYVSFVGGALLVSVSAKS